MSVILNLSSSALAAGRLAGQAEIVSSGERRLVRDAEELTTFLKESATAPVTAVTRDPRTSSTTERQT